MYYLLKLFEPTYLVWVIWVLKAKPLLNIKMTYTVKLFHRVLF